ncbi:MAG: hypothetical protein ACU0BB_05345 [Paracoccaceae bacterium]
MIRSFAYPVLGLMGLAVSAPTMAQTAVDPIRATELTQVVAGQGCQISQEDSEAFFPTVGFDDNDEVRAIIGELLYSGEARLERVGHGGNLKVYGGACPELESAQQAKGILLDILANNGCDLSVDDARSMLVEAGLVMQEVHLMMPLLQRDKLVSVSSDDQRISLLENGCPEFQSNDAEVDALISYLEANGCQITYESAQTELPKAGIDFDSVEKLVPDFVADGTMSVGENETLILNTGSCS